MLVSSFIIYKLDYCNGTLTGQPCCELDRLQSVIYAAVCLTAAVQRHDPITQLLMVADATVDTVTVF